MKFLILIVILLVSSCAELNTRNKVFIVERERESLLVTSDFKNFKKITDLGNLNHATLKFKNGFGYVLARDGFLAKIDPKNEVLIKKVKIGKSGIGITFTDTQVIVVNYEPNSVVVLDFDLNIQKTIETNSRNVGLKVYKNLLVFSLMDKNEIWVMDTNKNFELVSKFENVGNLPFDALINENIYIVGFFNEPSVGLLDLNNLQYKKVTMKDSSEQLVYKVPHFGYWGVVGNKVFVPMVSADKLLVLDLINLASLGEINLIGRPVFAAVSPNKKIIALNYSGEQEDNISIVDTSLNKKLLDFKAGKRVMHLRFSKDGQHLYVSSYFENKLNVYNTTTWKLENSITVSTPSGIFIEEIYE